MESANLVLDFDFRDGVENKKNSVKMETNRGGYGIMRKTRGIK